jgi:hypothetical protein
MILIKKKMGGEIFLIFCVFDCFSLFLNGFACFSCFCVFLLIFAGVALLLAFLRVVCFLFVLGLARPACLKAGRDKQQR